jgi:competence ComEA-like helix-hairpin-helix protein
MGLYDRDYMRQDDPADWWKPGYSLKRWLIIAILAVSLLTSALYLARSAGFGWTKQTATARDSLSLRVNINTATEAELDTLPNIGPARAKLIIANRPYKSVDELKKIAGIGDKQLQAMRPFVKTDGATEKIQPSR